MLRIFITCCYLLFLTACATSPRILSEVAQGERLFNAGYYTKARQILFPQAANGVPQAAYAVGYMYYYGLGTVKDTENGIFWISRAAAAHYQPAVTALSRINTPKSTNINRASMQRLR